MSTGAKIRFGILTVSDNCSTGKREDKSGPILRELVETTAKLKAVVLHTAIVPDERDPIQSTIRQWVNSGTVDAIMTTGGTGLHRRDITPDVTKALLDREVPGIAHALMNRSLQATPMAALSRMVAGTINKTLIVNLPGSHKAVQECWEVLENKVIQHAIDHLNENREVTDREHIRMQSNEGPEAGQYQDADKNAKSRVQLKNVSKRDRSSPYPMLSVEEAIRIVQTEVPASLGIDSRPLMSSLGWVCAGDVRAPGPHPPFPASIKDGYAVIAADGAGPRKVMSAITASHQTKELPKVQPGFCVRISTGAPIPPGADAVVQVEDTTLLEENDGEEIEIEIKIAPSKVGQDIRPTGSDIAKDELLISKGTMLTGSEIGILASMGQGQVKVQRKPTVAILSTGNEVADWTTAELRYGQIRDSNRPTLLSFLSEGGYPVYDAGIAIDQPEILLEAVLRSLKRADVLVTSGGVSMGERDLLKEVLQLDLGFTVHFGRVFMKPGKPTAFATGIVDGKKKIVFGLPGNPVSTFVTSNLYVLPSLLQMEGLGPMDSQPTVVKVKMINSIKLDPRPEYHRAVLAGTDEETGVLLAASTTANQISSRLTNTRGARILLKLPSKTTEKPVVDAGEIVHAMIIGKLGF